MEHKLDHYPSGRSASLSRLPDFNDKGHQLQRCEGTRTEPGPRNKGQEKLKRQIDSLLVGEPECLPTTLPVGWRCNIESSQMAPTSGFGYLGDRPGTTTGPSYHRFDFSAFKNIPISERFRMEFRVSSSTSSTIRISMLLDSAATAFKRFRTQKTSTTLTSGPSGLPAMLPTLPGKYNFL